MTVIKALVDEDRRKTLRRLSEESEISLVSLRVIFTEDLSMRQVAAKFVPRLFRDTASPGQRTTTHGHLCSRISGGKIDLFGATSSVLTGLITL